jgi:uncharacterized protein
MRSLWYGLIVGCSVACSATEPAFDDLTDDAGTRERRADTCGAPATPVHALQGDGAVSPLVGQRVSVEGVVSAVFPGSDQLGGFFLQSSEPDADPRTSEGVFVFAGGRDAVEVGRRLRVTGRVSEFYGLTQLNALERIEACGSGSIAALALPWSPAAREQLEAFEGMLVRVEGPLALTDSYRLERFGELALSAPRRFVSSSALPVADGDPSTLTVDDGQSEEPPWPPMMLAVAAPPRLGDELPNVTGVLNYAFGRYELIPTAPLVWQRRPRPAAPRLSGDFTVAALNLDNYFLTPGVRGAASQLEHGRQRSKLGAAIRGLDADLLAVTELENDGRGPAEDLALAAAEAGASYRVALSEADAGTDAIRSAFLYRGSRLTPLGEAELELDPVFRRPPLVQRFDVGGFALTVIVVHLKSKRCDEGEADALETSCGDAARLAESHALLDIARRRSLEAGSDGLLLLGDFNAYPHEEPIQELVREGFDEFMADVPAAARYSYVFDGQAGLLDHAFGTLSLRRRLRGAAIWHINADESPLLDYRLDRPAELFRPDAFRSSDHDPIVLSFDLP